MIKIIIKHTKPVPTFVGRNDYFNHQRLSRSIPRTLMLKLKNKQMKKIFLIFLISIVFNACTKDSISSRTQEDEVKDFVWKGLNAYYLWKDEVADLQDGKFKDQNQLNDFLSSCPSPDELFESLLYKRNEIDRWSWIVDDYEALEKMFQGVRKTTGMRLGLAYEPGFTNRVFAYVKYVLPQSPADEAGIKRGTVFRKVHNTYLDDQNYVDLLSSEPLVIELAQWQNNQLEDTGVIITLNKEEITENPIYISKTFNLNGKKIAYLMYNNFIPEFDRDLNEAMGIFKQQNIDELILDLRYNSGGSVATMQYLASMITGQFNGEILLKYQWHLQLQKWYLEKYPDKLYRLFTDQMKDGTPLNKLGLDKVYIIATKSSASASESLINCLDAYIDVIHIGTNTHGKYTASITLYDSPDFSKRGVNKHHKWAMQPIVLKIANAQGKTDFYNGLSPDFNKAEDYKNLGILGNPSEPLLEEALNIIEGNIPLVRKPKESFKEIFYKESLLDESFYFSSIPEKK